MTDNTHGIPSCEEMLAALEAADTQLDTLEGLVERQADAPSPRAMPTRRTRLTRRGLLAFGAAGTAAALAGTVGGATPAFAEDSPFLGEIMPFAGNFAPRGWALCAGQLLAISQNTALFSLLGTSYGGDGRTNFALPNLQSMVAVGVGQGPGLRDYVLGETSGEENVTLLLGEIPSHGHTPQALQSSGNTTLPTNHVWAGSTTRDQLYSSTAPSAHMHPNAVAVAGASQPHYNLMPGQAINYIIAVQGLFPPRS